MTLERFIAVSKPFAFKQYKYYVRYAIVLTALAWIMASIVLVQIAYSGHWLLVLACQTFILSVFLIGFLLPLVLYPIIAYNLYISKNNTVSTMTGRHTTTKRQPTSKNISSPSKIQRDATDEFTNRLDVNNM